jgi:hypothetical protein
MVSAQQDQTGEIVILEGEAASILRRPCCGLHKMINY